MKKYLIKHIIVIAIMTVCFGNLFAQQANTMYFMQGVPERNIYNPAFQAPYNFYLNIPILPSFGLSVGNNSLVLNDIIFNQNGRTISAFHPDAVGGKRGDFFNALHNTTRIYEDFSLNLIGFGFRKDKNYFTFDITLKDQAGLYLPKDLFNLTNGTASQDKFNFNRLGVNASLYSEVALGYSRQLDDKWTVGGRLKFLSGIANVSTDIKTMELNPSVDKWVVSGSGSLNASIPARLVNWKKAFKPDPTPTDANREIIDWDHIGDAFSSTSDIMSNLKASDFFKNFGMGVDLGATYNVLPQLQLSAAMTDLGFIRWSNNTANVSINDGYTFDGINIIVGDGEEEIKQKFQDELDKLKGIFANENTSGGSGKSYTTSLSTRFNIGGEYSLTNNKIGFGLLSSTLYANKTLFPDLTASVNFRPWNWFHPTVSYSILDGGFRTIGAGAQLKLGAVNLYLAVDKIPVGSNTYNKQYIPQYMNSTNLYAGMTWVFGDSRNKKCFNVPKGWIVDKYGCPIDSDGDGVPDSIDKCPNTPAGVTVDQHGCPIDTDGDGVPDYLDKCPNTPAGVAVDQYGCPIDSDGDGVADYMDECPNTPAGVTVDSKGCPIDSDGDGVPDYLDKCPNTPAGVAVDQFGCPIDTDGDGVPDYLDKCPTIPGTVANDGCPELKETEKAVFEKALRGIQFATGKDIITKASYPILDAIVMIMRENPTYFLTINGHTDNVGKPESNQILSEKRAAAVRNYIVSNGVDAGRLTIRGFGDTQPLVPNTTAANRTLNRRVEFIVKFEKEIEVAK